MATKRLSDIKQKFQNFFINLFGNTINEFLVFQWPSCTNTDTNNNINISTNINCNSTNSTPFLINVNLLINLLIARVQLGR